MQAKRNPLLLLLLLMAPICLIADDMVDEYPLERYNTIVERSPFSPKSLRKLKNISGVPERFLLVGIVGRTENPYVVISDVQTETRMFVSKKRNLNGYRLISLTFSNKPKKVRVVIEKNGESIFLSYTANEIEFFPNESLVQ